MHFFSKENTSREREREIISLLNKSLSKNFYTIFSPILPNLGRLCFGVSGEKTPGLHQNSLPLSLSTKHSSQQFFVLFSLISFLSSLFHLQPNTPLKFQMTDAKNNWHSPQLRERERERERENPKNNYFRTIKRERQSQERESEGKNGSILVECNLTLNSLQHQQS